MMKRIMFISIVIAAIFVFVSCNANINQENDETPPNGGVIVPPETDAPVAPDEIPPIQPEPEPPEAGETEPQPPDNDTIDLAPTLKRVKYVKSKVNSLNIRSSSGGSATVLGQIDSGELALYQGVNGGYYKTYYKGKIAHITNSPQFTELVELTADSSRTIENALKIGAELLGTPYELGAERLHWGNGIMNSKFTGLTYDCSSFTQYAYYKANKIILDITTRKQSMQGAHVNKADIKRGDLLFFTNSSRYNNTGIERIGHVGLYLGDNYMLHTASDHALIEQIGSKQWSYYITARRVA